MVTTPSPVRPATAPATAPAAALERAAVAPPLTLAEVEKQHIASVLERTGWHQGRAAQELGISDKTLYRKIRAYGFRRPGAREQ